MIVSRFYIQNQILWHKLIMLNNPFHVFYFRNLPGRSSHIENRVYDRFAKQVTILTIIIIIIFMSTLV